MKLAEFLNGRFFQVKIKLASFFKKRDTKVFKNESNRYHWVERLLRRNK